MNQLYPHKGQAGVVFAQKRSCGALDKSQVPGEVRCRVYLEGQGDLSNYGNNEHFSGNYMAYMAYKYTY